MATGTISGRLRICIGCTWRCMKCRSAQAGSAAGQARGNWLSRRREKSRRRRNSSSGCAGADRKSLDLKTNESKIADLRSKLNQATSNKEFDILKGQIDADTVANSVLQDEILELYDKIDRTQGEIKEAEAKAAKAKEEVQRFSKQFEADSVGLQARSAELTDEIKRSESGLTGEVAARYLRLVEAYGADAMAPAENGICGNCRVAVTPQYRVLLNSGSVVFCSPCGRLLYMPPKE